MTDRSKSLREPILARVLYRLGGHEPTGEQILRQYVNDVRGVYARHAHAVLGENK